MKPACGWELSAATLSHWASSAHRWPRSDEAAKAWAGCGVCLRPSAGEPGGARVPVEGPGASSPGEQHLASFGSTRGPVKPAPCMHRAPGRKDAAQPSAPPPLPRRDEWVGRASCPFVQQCSLASLHLRQQTHSGTFSQRLKRLPCRKGTLLGRPSWRVRAPLRPHSVTRLVRGPSLRAACMVFSSSKPWERTCPEDLMPFARTALRTGVPEGSVPLATVGE